MRLSKTGVILTIGMFALGAPGALAAALPKVPTYDGTPGHHDFKSRPPMIVYTGDASGFLAGPRQSSGHYGPLSWSSWTATRASGSGFNWLNNCRPSCAQGTFHSYPVTLHSFKARTVGGRLIFTRMRVTYTGSRPHGVNSSSEVWKVRHQGSTYTWSFPPQ